MPRAPGLVNAEPNFFLCLCPPGCSSHRDHQDPSLPWTCPEALCAQGSISTHGIALSLSHRGRARIHKQSVLVLTSYMRKLGFWQSGFQLRVCKLGSCSGCSTSPTSPGGVRKTSPPPSPSQLQPLIPSPIPSSFFPFRALSTEVLKGIVQAG